MKIKALITMLVLGSSSLALAEPTRIDARQDAQVDVRDHRDANWNDRDHRGPVAPAWITLASSWLRDGRTVLPINPRSGRFSTLKIESTGSARISAVMVEFANGQTQFVKVAQQLGSHQPITIDLAGNKRGIKRVVLTSHASRRGANVSVLAA
jgi:hypothetical protein